ncbi:hypothetical protein TNCV_2790831 [Trichonephila clavipes]|nr:hypothetical protein TNCV_2790831 [Trichonephila clavipes]
METAIAMTIVKCLAMVQTDIEARSEDTACLRRADNETVGAMHVCRLMVWSSRLLVYRGCSESCRRETGLFVVHSSKHILIVKSERPRC